VAVDIARRVLLDLASRTTEAVLAMAEDLQQIGVADNGVPYLVTVWLIVGPDDTRWITVEVDIPPLAAQPPAHPYRRGAARPAGLVDAEHRPRAALAVAWPAAMLRDGVSRSGRPYVVGGGRW